MRLFQGISAIALTCCSLAVGQSLNSILASHPALSSLYDLLKQFDLLDHLSSLSNITLLAPTNKAYLDLMRWGLNFSQVEPSIARAILTYHILEGEWTSDSIPSDGIRVAHTYLKPPNFTNTSQGAAVKLYSDGVGIISESGLQALGKVEEADILFENGVVHTLDSFMVLPHNISVTTERHGLDGILALLGTARLVTEWESLKDVTIFIPQNTALKKYGPLLRFLNLSQLAGILDYHVVPGRVLYNEILGREDAEYMTLHGAILKTHVSQDGSILVDHGKIVHSDLIIYGGVAHIIDDLLVPSVELRPDHTRIPRKHDYPIPAYQIPL